MSELIITIYGVFILSCLCCLLDVIHFTVKIYVSRYHLCVTCCTRILSTNSIYFLSALSHADYQWWSKAK